MLPFEVTNALLMAQRRRRNSASAADELEEAFGALPIAIAPADAPAAVRAARLACAHGLSVSVATCLELARQRRFAMASVDEKLCKAVSPEGLALAD